MRGAQARTLAGRVLRVLAWPLRRYFGTQFDWTRAQVVDSEHRLQARVDDLARRLEELGGELAELRGSLSMAALAGTEALADVGHELRLLAAGGSAGAGAEWRDAPSGARTTVVAPYVFRALGGLGAGARVLLFGPATAPLALSLASLGYRVTAVGARTAELRHPAITAVPDARRWQPPGEPFHAVVSIDAVDATGPGRNGERPGGVWAAEQSLVRLRDLTRSDGRLVLVALLPPAPDGNGGREDARFRLSPETWSLEDRTVVQELGAGAWRAVTGLEEPLASGRRLVLVTARAIGDRPRA